MYHWVKPCSLLFIFSVLASFPDQCWAQSQPTDIKTFKDLDVNFFVNGRLRYHVLEQSNFEPAGEALTLGVRAGLELDVSDLFSTLVEIEGNKHLIDDFNDTTNNRLDRPIILDTESLEINRLQLQTEIIPKTRLTVGRQDFALDNWRFLGAWHFRQNLQTYDAVRTETRLGKTRINLGYFNKVHRHLGNNSSVSEFDGDSFVFNVSHPLALGQLSAFHYALDLKTGPITSPVNILSNQTTGIRWHGRRHWDGFGLVWDASFARQSDYAENPDNYEAYYSDLSAGLQLGDFEFNVGLESLGSDNGIAIQTPLASLHNFQGVTDRFFRTPPDGLRDYKANMKYNFGDFGVFERVQAKLGYHDFKSDYNRRDYGHEVNFSLAGEVQGLTVLIEFGDYISKALPTDNGLFVSDARSVTVSAQFSFD